MKDYESDPGHFNWLQRFIQHP